jgi:hypothetical protein
MNPYAPPSEIAERKPERTPRENARNFVCFLAVAVVALAYIPTGVSMFEVVPVMRRLELIELSNRLYAPGMLIVILSYPVARFFYWLRS